MTSVATADDFKPMLVEETAALQFSGVDFRYSRRTGLVLRDVHFAVRCGRVLALTGPNGAGKTTALKLAVGFFLPTHGQVLRGALPAAHPEARKTTVYLADDPLVPRRLTGYEFFEFVAAARQLERDSFLAAAVREAEAFGLRESTLRDLASSLSRGQLRKLAFAAAFAEPPAFLALDEPTEALDDAGRRVLVERLRQFTDRGGAALLATHDRTFVEQIGADIFSLEVPHV